MNQKELTKTFMIVSNLKKPSVLYGSYKKYVRALRVNVVHCTLQVYNILWYGLNLFTAEDDYSCY